jgi:hypothetical protein
LIVIAAGCAETVTSPRLPKTVLPPPTSLLAPAELNPPGLPAVVVAELSSPDKEARFARNDKRALLATRSNGKWLVGPVRVDRDDESALAPVDGQSGMRPICPAPEGTPAALKRYKSGFLLAWVDVTKKGHEIWALPLDAEGKAQGEPRVVGTSPRAIDWVDVLADADDGYLVWDAKSKDGKREVRVAHFTGSAATEPITAPGGRGWHAVVSKQGLMFASVGEDGADSGRVTALRIAAKNGKLAAERVVVSDSPTALGDVQLAAIDGATLVAWTDRKDGDLHVHAASIRHDLAVRPPWAIAPIGGQGLVSLVPSEDGKRALIAWERETLVPSEGRTIELATMTADGAMSSARGELLFYANADAPEIVPDGAGFGALTLAPMRGDGIEPACAGANGAACNEIAPHFARFDGELRVLAAEPIRIGALSGDTPARRGVPEMVHALECSGGVCTVVARGFGRPSLLALAKLPVRESRWAAPAKKSAPLELPSPEAVRTIAEIDAPIADIDAAELSDGRVLLAWVTHVAGEPGEPAPASAKLQARFIAKDGALGEIITLTDKAISVGGVDVEALAPGSDAVAAIGWAGPNQGAQLFVTTIGTKGERVLQKTITKQSRVMPQPQKGKPKPPPSEVFDVDIAPDKNGGILCTWTDTRDGDSEIYAARVDHRLDRRGNEIRITNAKGPSTEPVLAVVGGRALIAWSEARDGRERGTIHVATIDAANPRVIEAGRELYRSDGHSRTPGFTSTPNGVALWWIEEAARGEQPEDGAPVVTPQPPGARLLTLDDKGRPLTQLRYMTSSGESLTSAAVGCGANGCRAVVVGPGGGELHFGARWGAVESGAPPHVRELTTLPGSTLEDVRLWASGSAERVLFADEKKGRTRIRELTVAWSK